MNYTVLAKNNLKIVSKGSEKTRVADRLDMAYAAEVELTGEGLAQLTWVDPFIFTNKTSSIFDSVFVYYYNNTTDSLQQIETCAMRKDHQLYFDMSIFNDGDEIHFWVFMKSTLTGAVSENSYAGSLILPTGHGKNKTNKVYKKEEIMPVAVTALNLLFQSVMIHTYNAAVICRYVRYTPVASDVQISPETSRRLQRFRDRLTLIMMPCLTDMGECILEIATINELNTPQLLQDQQILREAKAIFDHFGCNFKIPKNRLDSVCSLSGALKITLDYIKIIMQLLEYGEIDFGLKAKNQIHWKKLGFSDENYYRYEADKNIKPLKTLHYAIKEYLVLVELHGMFGLRNAG